MTNGTGTLGGRMTEIAAQVLRGFLMGAADVVPGVSGGTIALVLGIYRRLIAVIRQGADALASLVQGRVRVFWMRLRRVDWRFILPLVAGIGLAVVTLARVIEHLLEDRPAEIAALFFGLVVGSVFVAWRLISSADRRHLVIAAVVAIVAFVALGFRSGPVVDPPAWAFFAAGAVGICAMILPGLSGAFLLVMIGMYDEALGAVTDFAPVALVLVLAGAVVGLAAFSTLLDRLLTHHHDSVVAALVGLMAGSLRVLWPWPDGTATTALGLPGSSDWLIPVMLVAVGVVTVLAISLVAERSRVLVGGPRDD